MAKTVASSIVRVGEFRPKTEVDLMPKGVRGARTSNGCATPPQRPSGDGS